MTLNIELLRRTVRWVEEEEKRQNANGIWYTDDGRVVEMFWDQSNWRSFFNHDGIEFDSPGPDCGTALCAAGYMIEVSQNGLKWSKLPGHAECVVIPGVEDTLNGVRVRGDCFHIHRRAQTMALELLGIEQDSDLCDIAHLMFDGNNDADGIRSYAEELAAAFGLELFPANEPAR